MINNKVITFIFNLSIFLQICIGAHAWFVWDIEKGLPNQIAVIAFAVISLLYKSSCRFKLNCSPKVILILSTFLLAYLCSFKFSIAFLAGIFLRIIPLWVLISIPSPGRLLDWIIKAFCFFFVPGIALYFLLLFISGIPGLPYQYQDSLSYNFWNYGFILKPMYVYNEIANLRFCSVFLEPGYLGTLVSFLLYAIGFDVKSKSGKILLFVEVLSFSLAGYIITFIGFILYRFSQKSSIKNYLFIFVFVFIFIEVSKVYNGGNNVINHLIIERLQIDDEKGFTGNNRTGEASDFYFENVISSEKMYFGLGLDEIARINGPGGDADKANKIHGAGYKIFIITHGVIPTFLFFIFYWFSASMLCPFNRRYSKGFVFIIVLTFLQAAYPDSNSWIIPFLLGIRSYNKSCKY